MPFVAKHGSTHYLAIDFTHDPAPGTDEAAGVARASAALPMPIASAATAGSDYTKTGDPNNYYPLPFVYREVWPQAHHAGAHGHGSEARGHAHARDADDALQARDDAQQIQRDRSRAGLQQHGAEVGDEPTNDQIFAMGEAEARRIGVDYARGQRGL